MLPPAAAVLSQEITFTASTSNGQVAVDERFQVTFTLAGGQIQQPRSFNAPNMNADFMVMGGPYSSQQMNIINGRVSGSFGWSYLLQPRNVGTYTIQPATVVVQGKTYRTNTITIKVVKASAKPKAGAQGSSQKPNRLDLGDNIFLRAIPDKRQVYIGEPIVVTYKLYSRIPLQLNSTIKLPRMVGFWSEEIPPAPNAEQKVEVYNGKQYESWVLRRIGYFPTSAGKLSISPFEIDVTVQVRQRRKTGDPFYDEFFNNPFFDSYQPVNKTIMTERIDINSKPFPAENKPEGFKDVVGSYTMSSEIDRTRLKAGEALTLKATISGNGNIRFLEEPVLNLPNDFDHYPAVVTENLDKESGNTRGSKTFEYVIIPRFSGTRAIKPIQFSYFDPDKRKYVTLSSPEYTLDIAEGAAGQEPAMQNVKAVQRVLHALRRPASGATRPAGTKPGTLMFFLIILLPPLAAVTGIVLKRRYDKAHEDMVALTMRRATRRADKRLRTARKLLDAGKSEELQLEIARAVFGYVQERFSITTSELTRDAVRSMLLSREVSPALVDQLIDLVDALEYARFSPTRSEPGEMRSLFERARAAVIGVEQELKK
jgi:hypothetical protein